MYRDGPFRSSHPHQGRTEMVKGDGPEEVANVEHEQPGAALDCQELKPTFLPATMGWPMRSQRPPGRPS